MKGIYIHRGEVQRLTSLHDTFDRFGPAKKKKEEEKEKKKKQLLKDKIKQENIIL